MVAQIGSHGKISTISCTAVQPLQGFGGELVHHYHIRPCRQIVKAVVAVSVGGLGRHGGSGRVAGGVGCVHIDRNTGDARFGTILYAIIGKPTASAVVFEHAVA